MVWGLGLLGAWALGGLPLEAQVLARPGWAGSGVAPEAWWLRAVFYRVDPARFQDSDGDGCGDLKGILQRLDYLQSLGVDALLLDGTVPDEDLGELVGEASRRHLRVLVTMRGGPASGSGEALLRQVRSWLSAGAAGVWLPQTSGAALEGSAYPALVSAVRGLLQTFPGERALLIDPLPVSTGLAPHAARYGRHGIDPSGVGAARDGVLVATALSPLAANNTGEMGARLAAAGEPPGPGLHPLLRFASPPATGAADAVADAAFLLGSRGAVVLDFGEEIGLDAYPAAATGSAAAALPVMQWTPSNRTPVVERADAAAAGTVPGPSGTEFGAYHPYLRPPRGLMASSSAPVRVTADGNLAAAPPDPDSLPGFTAGYLPTQPAGSSQGNVAAEERDPGSLLNAYRQLIALHHGNAAIRNGSVSVLKGSAGGVLVWVRRPPGGSHTVAAVVVATNLSDHPATLSLNSDLEALGVRPGGMRTLFASAAGERTGETTEHVTLPPHTVLIAELRPGGTVLSRRPGPRSDRRVSR